MLGCSREHHRLPLEVLYVRALGQKLRHVIDNPASIVGQFLGRAREYGGPNPNWSTLWQTIDDVHQWSQVLCSILFGRDVNLNEVCVAILHVVVKALVWVRHVEFAILVVLLKPVLQGSTNEATTYNSYLYHNFPCNSRGSKLYSKLFIQFVLQLVRKIDNSLIF